MKFADPCQFFEIGKKKASQNMCFDKYSSMM